MSIIWTIIVGFLAGVGCKVHHAGKQRAFGFVLTTILGIVGAILASYLGQALSWYRAGAGADFAGNRRAV
jgi:uncharacterized membrane protein YeaQ/YmgE (transglycosylase-associated protein family)